MGNSAGKLNTCFCPAGEISGRHDIAVVLEGIGHSFCYIRPPETFAQDDVVAALLPTISGASVSANTTTPLSTALFDPFLPATSALDRAASFESSPSFASVPLQPIPRSLISSGPLLRNPGSGSILGSGPIERGFLSGPIERGFMSGPMDRSLFSGTLENRGGCKKTGESSAHSSGKSKQKLIQWSSIRGIKDAILGAIWGPIITTPTKKMLTMMNQNESIGKSTITTCSSSCSSANLSSQGSLIDDNENRDDENLQWAHGKAGEDRVHVVVSEEHGWVFVGIYDGFNGPDATDFLLSNLYPAVHKELNGALWNDQDESDGIRKVNNEANISPRNSKDSDVLAALSEALRKTEEAYLGIADKMILENPVLSLMGSCVLVMLMVGDDVYLMNVGDSRAVLGQRTEDLERVSSAKDKSFEIDPFDDLPNMAAIQLTVDHNTLDKEEVERLKREHPNDHGVIANERVKGSLKVTRAFGAGFLKNPKWNKGLLEMFRIDYAGIKPYITCSPSLCHHKINPDDKFLILSSDGLYQYFNNEEAVNSVEQFMISTPEGDPAQHLIEEVLFRAAKKAGIEFHELLDIPQGERRRYHDDVFIIIVSFEGRTWHSSL